MRGLLGVTARHAPRSRPPARRHRAAAAVGTRPGGLPRPAEAELDESKARLAVRDAEIEKLQLFLAVLRRQRFGRSSEKSHPDQLALQLEAIEEQIAALEAKCDPAPAEPAAERGKKPRRRPLPEHLPREESRHEPAGCACPSCGGRLHSLGKTS